MSAFHKVALAIRAGEIEPDASEPRRPRNRLRRVAAINAGAAIAVSTVMAIAWVATRGSVSPSARFLFDMKFNTAIGFAGLGGALLLMLRARSRDACIAAAIPILIGALTLIEYASGADLALDQLLVPDRSVAASDYPGRPSPITATVLLALGVVVPVSIGFASNVARRITVKFLCFAVIAIAMQAFAGHLLHSSFAVSWGAQAVMSLQSASVTVALASGMMAYCWSLESGPVARLPFWVPGLLAFAVLLFDINAPAEVNAGIGYIPLVMCALWFARPYVAFVLAGVSTMLIALSYLESSAGEAASGVVIANQLLDGLAVWAIAVLVYLRRTAERGLAESRDRIREQHQALETFSHALAHDLREPVRTITAFSELAEGDPNASAQTRRYLDYLRAAALRMGGLIDSVSQYMRVQSGAETRKTRCDMARAAEEAVANLSDLIARRSARVSCANLPIVSANTLGMMQVLQNLIGNAATHCQRGVEIRIGARREGETWLFAVHDDGPGVPEEFADRIFEPFKRLSAGETSSGMGLTITRRILEAHGGSIWLKRGRRSGTTVLFRLPATSEDVARTEPAHDLIAPMPDLRPGLARVLLVDDAPSDLELSTHKLAEGDRLRCEFLTAPGAEAALALLRSQDAAGEPVDLVLLDVSMPGLDGFEMLDRMHAESALREIPVIMCSGSPFEIDQLRAKAKGAVGYVVKPPSLAKIGPVLDMVPTLWIQQAEEGVSELLAAIQQRHRG